MKGSTLEKKNSRIGWTMVIIASVLILAFSYIPMVQAFLLSLKTGKGNKTTGWKGTGSATFHYNTSIFRKMMLDYKRTGRDTYFDIQITNEDPTSSAGRQTIILEDCNIDGGILAKFDADSEYLDEDMDFTFEDFSMPEKFKNLKGFLTN